MNTLPKIGVMHPAVVDQLKTISKNLKELEYYSMDVDGNNPTDAIFYSKLKDQINEKIKEVEHLG